MRLVTGLTVILLVAVFSLGCASSSKSDTTPVPTITPGPAVLAHDLEVTVEPKETAIILLNPRPIGDRKYVQGRTVTIDVLPQPGWEVDKWLGPVFDVAGSTAKIKMNVSHSVIIRLVQSSASLPTQTPILGRVAESPLPTAQAITATPRPVVVTRTSPTPVPQTGVPAPSSTMEPAAQPISQATPYPVATLSPTVTPTPTRIPQPTPTFVFSGGLMRGATISGRVVDVDTGLPIANVRMRADDPATRRGPRADTGPDGRYTLTVAPGVYIVSADRVAKGYIIENYDDKYAWEDAARFTVTGTEVVEGIDFGLKRGATISGRVIDAVTGLPIVRMDVRAAPANGGADISWGETDIDGRYTLKGIPDGVVEVFVVGQGYIRMSKPVMVRDGQNVTGVDF